MTKESFVLWDIPTRCFHWLIVLCLPLSWWSAENDNYTVHQWLGYTLLVLVVTRIVWGFLGSRHSRFNDFLTGPSRLLAYIRGGSDAGRGHNPLGGLSVLALLSLLLLQAVSGLFNSDDVFFSGPLYYAASSSLRDAMGVVHELAFDGLIALVCLHILAVLYHQLRIKQPLLQAMIRGSAENRTGQRAPVPWWRALVILVIVAMLLWWGLAQAPQPVPMAW